MKCNSMQNLVLITIDCLRSGHVGCLGYEKITPNIDKLAWGGLSFSQAVSTAPCTPLSFLSIFTSDFPSNHKRIEVETHPKIFKINEDCKTLAEALKEKGYRTKGIHSNPLLRIEKKYGYARGFDSYEDLETLKDLPYQPAEKTTDVALSWIKKHLNLPFFIWIHYMDPHPPNIHYEGIYPLEELGCKEEIFFDFDQKVELHKKTKQSANYEDPNITEKERRQMLELYDAEIRYTDIEVGRLLKTLEEWEVLSNTLTVVTADHGYMFGEHGRYYMGDMLYDELIRVPLIFHGLGLIGKADEQVSLLDLAPTILTLLGLPIPASFKGRNMLSAKRKKYIFGEALRTRAGVNYQLCCLRTEDSKYVIKRGEEDIIDVEFYDLKSDPQEKRNLLG